MIYLYSTLILKYDVLKNIITNIERGIHLKFHEKELF